MSIDPEMLADQYQSIAQYIIDAIEGDWVLAWLIYEFHDGIGQLAGAYRPSPESDDVESFAPSPDIYLEIDDLRDIMIEAGQPWRQFIFTLGHDGKFATESTPKTAENRFTGTFYERVAAINERQRQRLDV